jgi:hypothetical protein
MNYKHLILILTIATTMCACKDNANTEPNPPEPVPLDTLDLNWIGEDPCLIVTYIGKYMKITYKDWTPLDWSEFDSAWAVDATLRNAEFTTFSSSYYDFEDKVSREREKVKIKGDSAKIKKMFNDFWEQNKKYVYCRYIKDSNGFWEQDYYIGGYLSICLWTDSENYHYFIDMTSYKSELATSSLFRKKLNRKVFVNKYF